MGDIYLVGTRLSFFIWHTALV